MAVSLLPNLDVKAYSLHPPPGPIGESLHKLVPVCTQDTVWGGAKLYTDLRTVLNKDAHNSRYLAGVWFFVWGWGGNLKGLG